MSAPRPLLLLPVSVVVGVLCGLAVFLAAKVSHPPPVDPLDIEHWDLLGTRVRVTNIEPGMAETEFSLVRFKGESDQSAKVYAGTQPLQAEDIADAVYLLGHLFAKGPPPAPIDGISSLRPRIISRHAPTSVATLGMPAAPASRITSGWASLRLVSTTTSICGR